MKWRCKHERIRCIHGDEINDRKGRRRACLDCGRSLEGELPEVCSVTGASHHVRRCLFLLPDLSHCVLPIPHSGDHHSRVSAASVSGGSTPNLVRPMRSNAQSEQPS